MKTLPDFQGPFSFDVASVNAVVTNANSSGNFALGHQTESGEFQVRTLGRSDTSLRELLTRLVANTEYSAFLFRYAETAQEAFESECRLFHEFRQGISNPDHPTRPERSSLRCPVCRVLF